MYIHDLIRSRVIKKTQNLLDNILNVVSQSFLFFCSRVIENTSNYIYQSLSPRAIIIELVIEF